MNTSLQSPVLAVAFAVTVAVGLTGLSLTGKTQESNADAACAQAIWPRIPEQCLAGVDSGRTVRTIAVRSAVEQPETMGQRFAIAFN
jgi:hypothetical protein